METINNVTYWERGDFTLLIKSLSPEQSKRRHETRYAMFRAQTELNGGNKADPEHWETVRHILTYEGTGHTLEFADSWDIGHVDPDFQIVQRLWSIHQEHRQLMNRITVTVEKNDTVETLARKEHEAARKEKRLKKAEAKKALKDKRGS